MQSEPKESPSVTERRRPGRPAKGAVTKLVSTRCPSVAFSYLKARAALQEKPLNQLMNEIIEMFCTDRPWLSGLKWRIPRRVDGVDGVRSGWKQLPIRLDVATAERFTAVQRGAGISMAGCAYTAIYWYIQYKYPPGSGRA